MPRPSGLFAIGCAAAALFSGCVTAPKSTPNAALPATAPVAAAIKPVETPTPETPAVEPPLAAAAPAPAPSIAASPVVAATPAPVPFTAPATIKGSQETSILLDNYTAFVAAVDGKKIEAGRKGWETPLDLEAGHRKIAVEFNRGVFVAHATLEFEAIANAQYEVKYKTDAELFGHNSYCSFWIVDVSTGKTVTGPRKTSVEKLPEGSVSSVRP